MKKAVHYTYSGFLTIHKGFSEDTVFNMHPDWDKKYREEYRKYLVENGFVKDDEKVNHE